MSNIPTPESCREEAAKQLDLAKNMSGEWALAKALTAIGYLMLADSKPWVLGDGRTGGSLTTQDHLPDPPP